MTEFRTVDEVKDARAALNATSAQLDRAVERKITEGGVCVVCGRERHANWEQLQPCVAEMGRRRTTGGEAPDG